jgi:hypothetical protein
MQFVYLHALVFILWMLAFEKNPWPTLTLAVSLEAIFLLERGLAVLLNHHEGGQDRSP